MATSMRCCIEDLSACQLILCLMTSLFLVHSFLVLRQNLVGQVVGRFCEKQLPVKAEHTVLVKALNFAWSWNSYRCQNILHGFAWMISVLASLFIYLSFLSFLFFEIFRRRFLVQVHILVSVIAVSFVVLVALATCTILTILLKIGHSCSSSISCCYVFTVWLGQLQRRKLQL